MAELQKICINGDCSDITGYTAGENITITGKVIAAPGVQKKLIAGAGISIAADGTISASASGDIFVVVDALPATGEDNKIYCVPNGDGTLTEYYYTDGKWEEIGTATIDLSNYYTKTEADAKFKDTTYASLPSITEGSNGSISINIISSDDSIVHLMTITAGDGLSVGLNGNDAVLNVALTKEELLETLGYREIPVTKTDASGTHNWVFLGKEVTS